MSDGPIVSEGSSIKEKREVAKIDGVARVDCDVTGNVVVDRRRKHCRRMVSGSVGNDQVWKHTGNVKCLRSA